MRQYHKNPRKISKAKFARLEDTLRRLGDLSGIVHDLVSDEIIGGNQRGRVFDIDKCDVVLVDGPHEPDEQGTVALGYVVWEGKRYAYRQVNWTPAQCEEANITANLGGGEWDFTELANWEAPQLVEWGFDTETLKDWKLNLAGLGELLESEKTPSDDAEPQTDRAEELREKWGVEPDQLWRLPSRTPGQEHRLICGDCTDAAVVERVMQGERAEFSVTDPPYNVKVLTENDDMPEDEFIEWCKRWSRFMPPAYVLTVGIRNLLIWDSILGRPQWIIAWVKRNGQGLTALGGTNKWDSILCYGVKRDGGTDVIEVSNDYSEGIKADGAHLTAKPVELWQKLIERFGGGIVYEPFSGSGTTIIAAENLSRQCRAVEISPAYVAVALQRYEDAFGITPELISPIITNG